MTGITDECEASTFYWRETLEMLFGWLPEIRDGKAFGPKEETLQGWLCAALREANTGMPATQIVQEIHLGDVDAEKDSAAARKLLDPGRHVRFDIAVLRYRDAPWPARNVEELHVSPLALVEVKSLNSAGGLTKQNLRDDAVKLNAAHEHFATDAAKPLLALLVVATDCRINASQEARRARIAQISRACDEVAGEYPWLEVWSLQPSGVVCHSQGPGAAPNSNGGGLDGQASI